MARKRVITRRTILKLSAVAAGVAASQLPMMMAQAQPVMPAAGPGNVVVADYIALRLRQLGCQTLFGVPGATCDPMFEAAARRGLKLAITASDLEAGYAADGYARMRGIGAVCVTYGVGTLSLVNAIAGAYVEHSPVVVINGGPTSEDLTRYREEGTLFSHSIGAVPPRKAGAATIPEADLLGDLSVFRRVTIQAVRITRSADAPAQIDAALLAAMREQRPVYIEVSKGLWEVNVPAPSAPLQVPQTPAAGEDALAQQIIARLGAAQKPVLILGEQIARYGLADSVTTLATKLKIPFVTTYLGKAVISEQSSHFVGVYDGKSAPPIVSRLLDDSDAILALGCTFGRQYRELLQSKIGVFMQASDGQYRDRRNTSVAASLGRLVVALNAASWSPVPAHSSGRLLSGRSFAERRASQPPATGPRAGIPGPGLTYNALVETVSGFLDPGFVVLTDTCLAQYPAADLNMPERKSFVSNALWNSIGYTPAAAIGVGVAEKDSASSPASARRPIVICGDGGFQMTAQALSTLARNNIRAIVIVLDNALYAIEEYVINGSTGYFSNPAVSPVDHLKLARWDYVMLARSMGLTTAQKVENVAEFIQALHSARAAQGPSLISATMNPRSLPSELFS
jgi:indolepyruvate decarboxylase